MLLFFWGCEPNGEVCVFVLSWDRSPKFVVFDGMGFGLSSRHILSIYNILVENLVGQLNWPNWV